jgi:hypothetical protein
MADYQQAPELKLADNVAQRQKQSMGSRPAKREAIAA